MYSTTKARKQKPCNGENAADNTADRLSLATPNSTASVLTTASLAVSPVMIDVVSRQSPSPSGTNTGDKNRPISARMLTELSLVKLNDVSTLCKNHITSVATKMTVNALRIKLLPFSHELRSSVLSDGQR